MKAYPALSQSKGEVVCVAGVRIGAPTPEWVRLWPVQFRDMAFSDRFKKYQVITLDVTRPGSDRRPESWTPNLDSIQLGEVVGTQNNWRRRKELLAGLPVMSMCEVLARQRETGLSLGIVAPAAVEDLSIIAAEDYAAVKAELSAQPGLWGPNKRALEPAPYTAKYRYRCDDARCNGHTQGLIDWEFVEACRSWRREYGSEGELLEKLRQKWLDEMCGPARDTTFFVGNQHLAPRGFLVLGVFWPKATPG